MFNRVQKHRTSGAVYKGEEGEQYFQVNDLISLFATARDRF